MRTVSNQSFKILLLLGLLIASVFLFIGGPSEEMARSLKHLWNLGHVGYFYVLSYLLAHTALLKKRSRISQWILLLGFGLLLGTLIEVLQYGSAREADIGDIVRDLTGSFLYLAFSNRLMKWSSEWPLYVVKVAAILLLMVQLAPLTEALRDEAHARAQFPVLSSFESRLELDRWDGSARRTIVTQPEISSTSLMQVDLTTARYSGVGLKYFPSDFSAYPFLKLRVFNPEEPSLKITLRMHDLAHEQGPDPYASNDRFRTTFMLKQGWNDLTVDLNAVRQAPKRREMSMTEIADVSLFVSRQKKPHTLYLDDVFLSQ